MKEKPDHLAIEEKGIYAADCLDFAWLSHKHEQQRRMYEWIRSQSTLS
jgi:hypothetical protein